MKQLFVSDGRLEVTKKINVIVVDLTKKDISGSLGSKIDGDGIDLSFEAVGILETVKQAVLSLKRTIIWIGNLRKLLIWICNMW